MIARVAALALVVASLGAAAPALADGVAEAKARFRRGADLYRQGRWRDAMAEFEAAYRLKPHGTIHFNVALCRERLEEWPGALRSYQDYLREVPGASDRAAVQAAMEIIEARLASAGVQVLIVYSEPSGARLSIDGKERGTTPLHAVLAPGSYALSLALDGHEPAGETVVLAAAASRVVVVALRPAPAPAAAPAVATAPDLAARPAAVALPGPGPVAPAPPPAPRARRHLAAWIAAGTAVAAAGAGAWLGWSARRDERAIDALPAPDRAAASARARDARSKARAANVLYAVAGGAAAASGALFVFEARF